MSWVRKRTPTVSRPWNAFSLYVILWVECEIICWPSLGLGLPSVCTWSRGLSATPPTDHFLALVYLQSVCDLVSWVQNLTLTISRPRSALRRYMISWVECDTAHWPSLGLALPSARMWSHELSATPHADCLACSALSLYVVSWVDCETACWPSLGLGLSSACTWSHGSSAKPHADCLPALVCPQLVRDLMSWVRNRMPTLSLPWTSHSWYVISRVEWETACWPSLGLGLHSACTWSRKLNRRLHVLTFSRPWTTSGCTWFHDLSEKPHTDHLSALVCPQKVCLMVWQRNRTLTFSLGLPSGCTWSRELSATYWVSLGLGLLSECAWQRDLSAKPYADRLSVLVCL